MFNIFKKPWNSDFDAFALKKDKQLRKFIQNDYETLANKPQKRLKQLQKYLPKPDREWLRNHPHHAKGFIKGSLESYRQGIAGVVQECWWF